MALNVHLTRVSRWYSRDYAVCPPKQVRHGDIEHHFFVPRVRWDPSSLSYQWSELGGSDLLGRERRAPPAGDQPKRSYHDMLIPLSLSLMSHVVKSRHKLSINLLPVSSSSTIPSFTNLPTPLPPLSFRLPSSAALTSASRARVEQARNKVSHLPPLFCCAGETSSKKEAIRCILVGLQLFTTTTTGITSLAYAFRVHYVFRGSSSFWH